MDKITDNKLKYSLVISEYGDKDSKIILSMANLDALPRFEIGDQFDAYFFNGMADLRYRTIVQDALHTFSSSNGILSIELHLYIRQESVSEQFERQRKSGILG